jgi:dihydrofolate synthase/folylpolyglutamate synthase
VSTAPADPARPPAPLDFARSDDPVLDRLLLAASAHPIRAQDIRLDRIERLLARMASPHLKLPPVFHVAGTNGKGSTVAFLRAALEAAGHQVHVFTSPHLVRVNERIRVSGRLATDSEFADALAEVLRFNADQPLSFFEAVTAAAFLLFAAIPADACVLEVGLGGRLDSTNVVPRPAVTGIANLALDHMAILGPTLRHIAAEKAGIAKKGVRLVTQHYPPAVAAMVAETAIPKGAILWPRREMWDVTMGDGDLLLRAPLDGEPLRLPLPAMSGAHQRDNAALALAMLKAQDSLAVPESALRSAMLWAQWPARLQQLRDGPLHALLPRRSELWVDGGHNPAAARALGAWLAGLPPLPARIVAGMMAAKDHAGFLSGLPRDAELVAVPIPGHASLPAEALAAVGDRLGFRARTAADLREALSDVAEPTRILVTGSLHLAGEMLRLNGPLPN